MQALMKNSPTARLTKSANIRILLKVLSTLRRIAQSPHCHSLLNVIDPGVGVGVEPGVGVDVGDGQVRSPRRDTTESDFPRDRNMRSL
jgi:hypothetical protein